MPTLVVELLALWQTGSRIIETSRAQLQWAMWLYPVQHYSQRQVTMLLSGLPGAGEAAQRRSSGEAL
jgi:hypothetical protein